MEMLEVAAREAADDGVGDVAHAGLQRQQIGGETALLDLVVEEVHDVSGDLLRVLVHRREAAAVIGQRALHHGHDLGLVEIGEIRADAVVHAGDQEGATMRRTRVRHDVVDAAQHRQRGVHLDDDLVGDRKDLGGDAHAGTQDQTAVLGDGSGLHHGDVQLAGVRGVVLREEAPGEVLGEGGQVDITHLDLAGVDALGNVLTGLVRPTTSVSDRSKLKIPRNHTQLGPAILGLGTHGGSSKQLELKLRALLLHHISNSDGNHLGIASRGESRPTDRHSVLEELVGHFRRGHDLAKKALASTTTEKRCRHLSRGYNGHKASTKPNKK